MNSTPSSGTPRQNSISATHSPRTKGRGERRPSASAVPSGMAPPTATKDSTAFSISPPQSAVGTGRSPNSPPASSTPSTTGTPTSSRANHAPRCRRANRQPSSAAPASAAARFTRHCSGGG